MCPGRAGACPAVWICSHWDLQACPRRWPPSFPSLPGLQLIVLAWVTSFQMSWIPEEVTSGHPSFGWQPLLNVSLWPKGRYLSGCFLDYFESQLDVSCLLCTSSGPACCGVEGDWRSVIQGNRVSCWLELPPSGSTFGGALGPLGFGKMGRGEKTTAE